MTRKKILFLCKDRTDPNYTGGRFGLYNSAIFVSRALSQYYWSRVELCIDSNEINKFVHKYKPDIVIVEAIWVTGDKLKELVRLHPAVRWIIRIHSKMPFLANEGCALLRCNEYLDIDNVQIAGNNSDFVDDMYKVGYRNTIYLPNIYQEFPSLDKKEIVKNVINISCFGAIRPLKNTLLQAVAALSFVRGIGKYLKFHINSSRTEQNGDNVLKNLRSLFDNQITRGKLVEHEWMPHGEFTKLVGQMDIGMQVSYSESFNIVSADHIVAKIPIVTSSEVEFNTSFLWADFNSSLDMADKLWRAYYFPKTLASLSYGKLQTHNSRALLDWIKVI